MTFWKRQNYRHSKKKKKMSVVSGGGREEQEELRNFRAVKLHHMMDTITGDTSHYTFV